MSFVVIAAHPDDELLGCGSLIAEKRVKAVIYPLAVEPERWDEACALARACGYDIHSGIPDKWAPGDTVLVPSPTDKHVEHQEVLTWACKHAPPERLMEYSIEKRATYVRPLDPELVTWKKEMLKRFYPSQVEWIADPAYFLFEGIAPLGPPSITVTFSQVGWHKWSDAPQEVHYLTHPHRHTFEVRLTLSDLSHHDRAFEFHLVQAWAKDAFSKVLPSSVVAMSCEHMARALACKARAKYAVSCTVEVWEDGENGAKVTV